MPITPSPTVAAGDTITSARANTDRDNFNVLDARTGGDPGGVNKWPQSDGATSASWVDRLTALASALAALTSSNVGGTLTFTPNQAGVQFSGNGGTGRSKVSDYGGQSLVIAAHNNVLEVYDQALSTTAILRASLPSGPGSQLVQIGDNTAWHDGNTAGAVSTAKLADGAVTSAKIADGTIATGDIADSAITPAKLDRTYARVATGTYTGNDASSRQITVGFQCKYVFLAMQPNATYGYCVWHLISTDSSGSSGDFAIARTWGSSALTGGASSAYLHTSDGFMVTVGGLENINGITYRYVAFG